MRIIAGEKRGMKLFAPKGVSSRPITDRVKESVFAVLGNYDLPAGSSVADLFCGVGSIGLEALSRGSEFTLFVERDPKMVATLRRNITKAGFTDRCQVMQADAFSWQATGARFDLVLVDPPYAVTDDVSRNSPLGRLLCRLSDELPDGAIAVVRTSGKIRCLEQYGRLAVTERRTWGSMAVTFFRADTT